MYVDDLRLEYALFLSDFIQTLIFSTDRKNPQI